MSCWSSVPGCLFVCVRPRAQAAGEGARSASSWEPGSLPRHARRTGMELSPQILKGSTHSSRKPTHGSDGGGHELQPSHVHGVDVPVASHRGYPARAGT